MRLSSIFVGALAALLGCGDDPSRPPADELSFSFESGMEGWSAAGIDLELGDGQIEWSIAPSGDRASDGARALKLYLNNLNDAGKIWVERAVPVRPNRTYEVRLQFDLASADYGFVNLFRIIAGAFPSLPRTRDALAPAFRDETGNGSDSNVGYLWKTPEYTATVQSGASGTIYVVLGVWGTWEGPRTYYLDDVRISLTER